MLLSLAVRASCSYTALPISPGWPSMITNGCVCVCVTVAAPSEERQGEASRWKNFPARHVVPLFYKYNGIITYLYVTRTVALKKRLMTTVCVCVFAGDQAIWGGCLETVRQHSPHLWKLVHVSPPPFLLTLLRSFLPLSSCTVYFSPDDAGKDGGRYDVIFVALQQNWPIFFFFSFSSLQWAVNTVCAY